MNEFPNPIPHVEQIPQTVNIPIHVEQQPAPEPVSTIPQPEIQAQPVEIKTPAEASNTPPLEEPVPAEKIIPNIDAARSHTTDPDFENFAKAWQG